MNKTTMNIKSKYKFLEIETLGVNLTNNTKYNPKINSEFMSKFESSHNLLKTHKDIL